MRRRAPGCACATPPLLAPDRAAGGNPGSARSPPMTVLRKAPTRASADWPDATAASACRQRSAAEHARRPRLLDTDHTGLRRALEGGVRVLRRLRLADAATPAASALPVLSAAITARAWPTNPGTGAGSAARHRLATPAAAPTYAACAIASGGAQAPDKSRQLRRQRHVVAPATDRSRMHRLARLPPRWPCGSRPPPARRRRLPEVVVRETRAATPAWRRCPAPDPRSAAHGSRRETASASAPSRHARRRRKAAMSPKS